MLSQRLGPFGHLRESNAFLLPEVVALLSQRLGLLATRVSQMHILPFFFIFIVCKEKALKRWGALAIIRKFGGAFTRIIFKNTKILHSNDFLLIFEIYPINCMTIVAY